MTDLVAEPYVVCDGQVRKNAKIPVHEGNWNVGIAGVKVNLYTACVRLRHTTLL